MSSNERDPGSAGASQSSVARTFSADLNNVFSINKDLGGLVESVEQKKQAVSSQTQELEALEAKLRETEQRLKEKQSSPTAKRRNDTRNEQQASSAIYGAESKEAGRASGAQPAEKPLDNTPGQGLSASTMAYWRSEMPGTLPETPGDSAQNSYLAGRRDKA